MFTARDIAVASQITHPLKATLSTSQLTKTAFMVHSGTIGSTTLTSDEYFGFERYRVVSGNYVSQSNATSSANKWNSNRSVNDNGSYPEHATGLVGSNNYLISPLQIGNDGDTRNTAQGGAITSSTQTTHLLRTLRDRSIIL